jgi:energy-coupling factor transport system substrate-specific component
MLNVGVMAAVLWATSPVAVVLLALPMMLLRVALQLVTQLKDETLKALIGVAEMVDARDSYAYRHSMEVARISNQIATRLGLSLEEVDLINLAGMLHDIGKIGTPDRVLHKPSRLDDDERAVMELHPTEGAKVLQYFSLFRQGADLVLYHQEHFDGTGYPRGLSGESIPVGARIIHVADAYQAMTSDRVYRKALPVEEALRRLRADSGKQFDPEIVEALFDVLAEQGIAASREAGHTEGARQQAAAARDDGLGVRAPELATTGLDPR